MATTLVTDLSDSLASEVLEQLFRDHSGMVYRTAYGVTGNREDAQDILQTIFLRLLRRELPQDFCQTPKAYFYRAAVNLSLDTLKARRRRSFITGASCAEMPAPTSELDQDDHARLYEAVAALGPTNAEIIILRYVHDYTDAQIAQMLGKVAHGCRCQFVPIACAPEEIHARCAERGPMKSLEARLRRHANPKPESVDEDIERVRRRLQSETQGMQEILVRFTPPRRAGRTRRAIELVLAASFLAAVAVLSIVPRLDGAAAVVEAGDDGLHRIVKGEIQPLRVGQKVDSGEIIRVDGASSATLALDDGSRVEMGPTSELSLDNSRSVMRVNLNEGSIIVSAGKAIEKSFSIQTQDATVSLEDTVSVVAIEQARSRVAVIKGQALVEESGTARRLGSGEEIATGTLMAASRPLIEEVAWSRLIREHQEVLQQAKPPAGSERFEVNAVRREKENSGLRGSPVRCNAVDGIFPLPPRGLTAGVIGDSSTVPRGRCVGRYVTLMTLITVAYDVPERNISGGPDWVRSDSETFQIEAKAEAISTATKDQLRVMLQKLLAERFKLRIRRDSKDAPGYALVVSTNGSKLQQTSGDAELYLEQNGRRNQFNLMQGGQISIKGRATIQAFANYLSVAPVIALNHVADKTGLPGMYEFSLTLNMVAPEFQARGTRGGGNSAGGPRVEWDPSISKAIEEQLGLSLVSQRVFEEVIFIEHAERPSDD